jgi:hypothetical protein
MGVSAGPRIEIDELIFAFDAKNTKTFDDIPGITDHGISDWYCFKTGSATYSAIYPNTEIIEIDSNGNETVKITTGSDPQRGSISITSGKRYFGTKAIHILDEGVNDAIAPVSFAGTYFGNYHNRADPKTVNIYAPQDDINVSVYEDVTGGVTGTATSTFSISKENSDTYVTTAGTGVYMLLKTDKPAIMTVGSGSDDHVMQPMSQYTYRRRYNAARPGRTINNTAPSNLNSNAGILYDTSLPVFSLEVGDGLGGDSTQGIGYEYLSDTFSWGNVLSDYKIVAPYADTTVTVSYWASSQWNVGEVHSLSGTQTSPANVDRDGTNGFGVDGSTISGAASNLASGANLWKWESTKPIAIIINDNSDDEENLLGWMSNNSIRNSSNVNQSFLNLINKNNRRRMKMYGKRLTTNVEYAGARLSAGDYMEFDGVDDRIVIPHADSQNSANITISAFVYPTNLTGGKNIIGKGANSGYRFRIYATGANVFDRGNTNALTISYSFSTNTWYYVSAIFSSSGLSFYVNGELLGSNEVAFGGNTQTTPLVIGAKSHTNYSSESFQGNIANLKMYSRALTASEINQNFNALRGRFGI